MIRRGATSPYQLVAGATRLADSAVHLPDGPHIGIPLVWCFKNAFNGVARTESCLDHPRDIIGASVLQKRTARYVQVFGGETEPAQIARFVRAMRMIGVEQVAQDLCVFDESVFRIGQLHACLDKRPISVPKDLMSFTTLTIRGFQWRGFDRVR